MSTYLSKLSFSGVRFSRPTARPQTAKTGDLFLDLANEEAKPVRRVFQPITKTTRRTSSVREAIRSEPASELQMRIKALESRIKALEEARRRRRNAGTSIPMATAALRKSPSAPQPEPVVSALARIGKPSSASRLPRPVRAATPAAPRVASRFSAKQVDVSDIAKVLFPRKVAPSALKRTQHAANPFIGPAPAKTVRWADTKGKPLCEINLVSQNPMRVGLKKWHKVRECFVSCFPSRR